jgi:hypothetical protein
VEVDLKTLCRAEAVFVVMLLGDFGGELGKIMLWGDGLEQFHRHCAQSYGMRVPFLLGKDDFSAPSKNYVPRAFKL